MKSKYSKQILASFTTIFMMSAPLVADQEEINQEINSRPTSEEALLEAIEKAEIAQTEEAQVPAFSVNDWKNAWSSDSFDAGYRIRDFETAQNIVRLTDGSQWKVYADDLNILRNWLSNQPIAIQVNSSWTDNVKSGKTHYYLLTNVAYNSSVRAFPFLGSNKNSPVYRKVIGLQKNGNQVSLNDGSSWLITSDDASLFEEWEMDDTIILGTYNAGWFSWNNFPTILLNCNSNHYVRAKKI